MRPEKYLMNWMLEFQIHARHQLGGENRAFTKPGLLLEKSQS